VLAPLQATNWATRRPRIE